MLREFIVTLLALIMMLLLIAGAAMLTGCAPMKYVECVARDATSRPCN